jgi:aspartate 1-decarboxylase
MPRRTFLNAKLHGATLTTVNLDYEGSISVDPALLKAAGILPNERVDVYNLDNGERLTTYAIPGGPGEICLNGAAAHKGAVGQRVIIVTYLELEPEEIPLHKPRVIRVGAANRPEAAH